MFQPPPLPAPSRRHLLLAAGAGLALGSRAARAADGRTLRLGYQRYGTLILLKHTGLLERALAGRADRVSWAEFPAGPQMLQAMQADAVDFGIVGDAPPVFAQAVRPEALVYVAHEPRAPFGEAIIVPASSPVRGIADLKGRSVALNRASNVHWLLLASLQKAGLRFSDIRPVYLAPAAARPAFESGRVDAWATWDPYLSAAQTATHPRVIAWAGDVVGNRQFFIARRAFAERHPDLIRLLLAQLAASDQWSAAHRPAVSQALAADTGLPVAVVQGALDRLAFGVRPMTPDVVAEQQRIADAFHAEGLIPAPIRVADAVWPPPG